MLMSACQATSCTAPFSQLAGEMAWSMLRCLFSLLGSSGAPRQLPMSDETSNKSVPLNPYRSAYVATGGFAGLILRQEEVIIWLRVGFWPLLIPKGSWTPQKSKRNSVSPHRWTPSIQWHAAICLYSSKRARSSEAAQNREDKIGAMDDGKHAKEL